MLTNRRYGAVGCCPPGQDCQNAIPQQTYTSVLSPVPVPIATTAVQTVTTNPAPSTVLGVVGTVTSAVGGAAQTVTSAAGGAYSTVSGILVGKARREEPPIMLMGIACLSIMVWLGG